MIARGLQIASLLVGTAVLALALSLVHNGGSETAAFALAAAIVVGIHGVPLAIEFITGAIVDRSPAARIGPLALIRVWWGETRRQFRVFMIDQPWRSRFSEPELVRDPQRPAVLLIHGYLCNRAMWRPWIARLAAGRNIATVNLEPAFGPIERYADDIEQAVERLCAATGARQVILVGHSMGGLAAREYLQTRGAARVERLVTLASPHHGTVFAPFGHGANARQMRRDSSFIARLSATPCAVPVTCIATRSDNLVLPRSSAVLAGASEVWLDRVGHLAMTDDSRAFAALIAAIDRPRATAQQ
ncbi:MAG: alpha/beta fold hydrolase [Burkholderiaceae bacterium]